MTTSRDIKALFGRFGGDASGYQEIHVEKEATDARGRWPLLGMIDPRKVELAPSQKARDASAASAPAGDPAAAAPDGMPAGGAPASRDRSQAALRRTAPLFTRSPRRDVPPVVAQQRPFAPESATYRFSPLQADREGDSGAPLSSPAAAAGPVAGAVPPTPPVEAAALAMPVPPVFATAQQHVDPASSAAGSARASSFGAAAGTSVRTGLGAVPRVQSTAAQTQTQTQAQTAPRPAASPLKKLFGAPAAATPSAQDAPAAPPEARLDALFSRLRGDAPADAPAQSASAARLSAATPGEPSHRPLFAKGAPRS